VIKRLRSKPLDDPRALSGFVRRTVDYSVIGFLRKQARRSTTLVGEWPEHLLVVDNECVESIAKAQTRTQVRVWVESLKQPRDRELLRRRFLEDQSKIDICGALDVSAAQFDRLIYRAKKRMRVVVESCAASVSASL